MAKELTGLAVWIKRGKRRPFGLISPPAQVRVLHLEQLEERILLDAASAGNVFGINSRDLITPLGTTLTGAGVAVGQVEVGRPAMSGLDDPKYLNSAVTPAKVAWVAAPATADTLNTKDKDRETGNHAEEVAGVIIANGVLSAGVAPQASLYASASDGQTDDALAFQHLIQQAGADGKKLQVMNYSSGQSLETGQKLDGNSTLSQFIDWSAETNGVLYTLSGNQINQDLPVPTDSFNGITVGSTIKDANGVFDTVRSTNDTDLMTDDGRQIIDLVAPGGAINVPALGNDWALASGTSFAAPHVAGAAALLDQYAADRIAANAPGFRLNEQFYTRPEVIKAVLMNSADKLKDAGDGLLLGMDKTVYMQDSKSTWLDSSALNIAGNSAAKYYPLDPEMGTGQLDVQRAVKQYAGGMQGRNLQEPPIGWNLGNISAAAPNGIQKYGFANTLKGGSYVSLTMTWNRDVQLAVPRPDNLYTSDAEFTAQRLPNLDLYLMPKDATSLSQALWSSNSSKSNVEHIFYKLPPGDAQYEFWVRRARSNDPPANYAIAWWAMAAPRPANPSGGRVEGGAWQDNGDGLRSPTESLLPGIAVSLVNAAGSPVMQTLTAGDGTYTFGAVSPGDYHVEFAGQVGYHFTTEYVGTDPSIASQSDAYGHTATFTVSAGGDTTLDAGLVPDQYGSITGVASYDSNGDGVRQSTETLAGGVAVSLFNSDGNQVASTASDASGNYQFFSVAPGDYRVSFAAPAGYAFTTEHVGTDLTADSDVDASGVTDPISVAEGGSLTHLDVGLVQTASFGGHVWVDASGDGVRQAQEPPMGNTEIELHAADGTLIATTSSGDTGDYLFTDLAPGSYYVQTWSFSGYHFAPASQGTDRTLDSDIAPATGMSAPVSLAAGQVANATDAGLIAPTTGILEGWAFQDDDHDQIWGGERVRPRPYSREPNRPRRHRLGLYGLQRPLLLHRPDAGHLQRRRFRPRPGRGRLLPRRRHRRIPGIVQRHCGPERRPRCRLLRPPTPRPPRPRSPPWPPPRRSARR
jgi:protocatechuate 3,4-dioxygenase beta subunit